MKDWSSAPTHTVAGMIELHEQLLPTKVYTTQKTKTTQGDVSCRLCGKAETLPHILSGCSTLAQSKYLDRHNAALKIFFEKCKDLKLVEGVPPWYSPVKPKLIYESDEGKAFWDVVVYAEHTYVRANRIDARLWTTRQSKSDWAVEMSCPWIDNRAKKVEEKATKYGPLLLELKQQHPGYKVQQCNIIIDALGGWSKDVEETMKKLVGA